MSLAVITRLKLRNVLGQIESQLNAESTFRAVPTALLQLQHIFQMFERRLEKAVKLRDQESLLAISETINQKILHVLPVLGFLLRSTNVRNAFELLEPLHNLSAAFLGKTSRLLLSAEWDWVPFAYPQSLDDLRNFTFIGLPASESANLLVLPLAGHELGHAVWRSKGLEGSIYNTVLLPIEDEVQSRLQENPQRLPEYKGKGDLVSKGIFDDIVAGAVDLSVRHSEEFFCDFFALALFGSSYLRAFAYVLAPGMGRERKADYPSQNARAAALADFAGRSGVHVPPGFQEQFRTSLQRLEPRRSLTLDVSETVTQRFLPAVWESVNSLVRSSTAVQPSTVEAQRVFESFRGGVPFSSPRCLGDIAIAAWLRFDEIVAEKVPFERQSEKLSQLNEMALKTAEVLEFNQRLQSHAA